MTAAYIQPYENQLAVICQQQLRDRKHLQSLDTLPTNNQLVPMYDETSCCSA